MKFFHGFSLEDEAQLFKTFLTPTDLTVAGFSYGAQEAFEYAYHTKERIDRLILLSPAFFQNQKPSFIRTQLRYYRSDQEAYVKQFLLNSSYPSAIDLSSYLSTGTEGELEALLTYTWDCQKIQELKQRGITIEVFLGEADQIIDAAAAYAFFSTCTTTYYIKGVGHILTSEESGVDK